MLFFIDSRKSKCNHAFDRDKGGMSKIFLGQFLAFSHNTCDLCVAITHLVCVVINSNMELLNLPNEILTRILAYLPESERHHFVALVCKRLLSLSRSQPLFNEVTVRPEKIVDPNFDLGPLVANLTSQLQTLVLTFFIDTEVHLQCFEKHLDFVRQPQVYGKLQGLEMIIYFHSISRVDKTVRKLTEITKADKEFCKKIKKFSLITPRSDIEDGEVSLIKLTLWLLPLWIQLFFKECSIDYHLGYLKELTNLKRLAIQTLTGINKTTILKLAEKMPRLEEICVDTQGYEVLPLKGLVPVKG